MKTTVVKAHKSSIGDLNANVMVLILFISPAVLGFIPGVQFITWAIPLIIFFMEKKSKFVKFYAITSIGLSIICAIFFIIFAIIAVASMWSTGGILFALTLPLIISIAFLVLYIYLIVVAWKYKQVELPLVGPLALKYSGKPDSADSSSGSKKSTSKKKTTKKK